jgi:hypothetical protein
MRNGARDLEMADESVVVEDVSSGVESWSHGGVEDSAASDRRATLLRTANADVRANTELSMIPTSRVVLRSDIVSMNKIHKKKVSVCDRPLLCYIRVRSVDGVMVDVLFFAFLPSAGELTGCESSFFDAVIFKFQIP